MIDVECVPRLHFSVGTLVSLYSWTEPVMAPMTMPDMKTPLAGLTQVMEEEETFNLSLEKKLGKLDDLTLEQGLIFRIGHWTRNCCLGTSQ